MPPVKPDIELAPWQNPMPVLWLVSTAARPDPALYADELLAPFLPPGRVRALRSFGHDRDTVHWLLTRAGTPLHTDPAYARYSYQLVLRNDGNKLRGLPRFDQEHPVLSPGVMYCLDTHSPHIGLPDPRLDPPKVILKVAAALDSDALTGPHEVWPLLRRKVGVKLPAALDPEYKAAPRLAWAP